MMRTFVRYALIVLCVCALVVTGGACAIASTADGYPGQDATWEIFMACTSTGGEGELVAAYQFGTRPPAYDIDYDAWDMWDASNVAGKGASVVLGCFDNRYPVATGNGYYKDIRPSYSPNNVWKLKIYLQSSCPVTGIKFTAWNQPPYGLSEGTVRLTVTKDPTGSTINGQAALGRSYTFTSADANGSVFYPSFTWLLTGGNYSKIKQPTGGPNIDNGYIELTLTSGGASQSAPAPVVAADGVYTSGVDSVRFTWSAVGAVEYEYAVGSSPTNLIVSWRSAGAGTEVVVANPGLFQVGRTYYCYVRAKSAAGQWSDVGASDGIIAAATTSIGQARTGTAVYIVDAVVTSTASDFAGLWLEASNRTSAVAVPEAWSVSRGDRVQVAGVFTWVDGVPTLSNPELKKKTSGSPVAALGMGIGCLASDRRECLRYCGVSPVGLLVTTWGRVTRVDTNAHVFYIDDGSRLTDGMGPGGDPYIGLRVGYRAGVTPPAPGDFVSVTGVRTVDKVKLDANSFVNGELRLAGEMLYLPVVRIRD